MAKQKPAKTRSQLVGELNDANGFVAQEPASREAIEKLAYQYWIERGCPLGSPDQDWLRAERHLSSSVQPVQAVRPESVEVHVQAA
jgi:hypothetical protein